MSTVALSWRRIFTTSSWPIKLANVNAVYPFWSGRKWQLSWMNGKNIELMTARALQTPREPVSYLRKKQSCHIQLHALRLAQLFDAEQRNTFHNTKSHCKTK